jgi:hypothetical protein
MAINDKENPDEGTPRSNKDIRKERRQMRAVNRDRKSMGAEPLYSKEEIKGVKQPFKAAPGNVVAGTPVVVDDTPDVEYIKAGYGSGEEGKEFRKTFKAGTQEAEEIRKDSEAGQQLVKTLANIPNPAQETQDILQVKADNKTDLTSTDQENLTKANKEVGNEVKKLDDAITNEEIDAKNAMSNIGDVVQNKPGQDGWIDTYVTESFEPESKEDILARAAVAARKKAPQLAIEKLGVQDYYPEIGRDIAVGTFSGSRIGSQTIYSGAGGVLPLGLYDARKRAIAADIKKKQALMDELKEMPDIAKQYKPAFAQYFYNGLMDYVEAYKDNPEGLASDPGYLKFMSTEKGVAENFSKTSAYLKDLEEKLVDPKTGEPAAWVTKDMMSIINNVKTGMLPGKIEEYFSGKKNIAKVLDTVRALPNALNQGDEIVKTLIKDGGIERAINLKTGKDFNPDELEDLNNLVKQINSPSPDYEMFSELKRKYFDFNFDKIAEEWVKNNMADQSDKVKEEVKKNMANYMFEQMPKESIISTITKQANDYTTRRGQDLQLLSDREDRAFRAEQARLDREDSITKLEMEEMLDKGEKVRTVRTPEARIGDESPDNAIYNVYDPQQGKFRQVTGASIKRDQKSGYKYYDRTGKNLFEVPSGSLSYQQGNITYYNNNGNIKAKSTGTGYTTKYNSITGQTDLIPLNVDVSLPVSEMTISSGKIDNGRAGEFDITRSKNVSGAAKGTGGTGSYVTGFGRSSSGPGN